MTTLAELRALRRKRTAAALALRRAGKTYKQIALEILRMDGSGPISPSMAHVLVFNGLKQETGLPWNVVYDLLVDPKGLARYDSARTAGRREGSLS